MRWIVFFILTGPACADVCPPPPDIAPALEQLIAQAQAAKNDSDGQAIGLEMWKLWADAPDDAAQEMLDRGMGKRRVFDLLGAISDFDDLVAYCPDYAEGYNQRAFANFLAQNFDDALVDLDRALARSPRHIAAMSGKVLTLMELGRLDEARALLAKALALNPWIPERGLALPGAPLAPLGKDI
jgi:tetratricopeptide (TPR) repeat protein